MSTQPNCNPFAERFVRSIKEKCLNRMIILGDTSLRRLLREYVEHYHHERTHQGIWNELIEARPRPTIGTRVRCEERLGGLLRHCTRAV